MDKFLIQGGTPLHGTVTVSGAKNAALPLLAASVLTPKTVILRGVPLLHDIETMQRLLSHIGVRSRPGEAAGTIRLQAEEISRPEAPYEVVKTMRASSMILGPLLARTGRARVSLPGGCAIGARPMDQHLKAFAAMGAEISIEEGYISARLSAGRHGAGRLRGADISFDMVTVTGTENVMMAAVLADGETILRNAAREPEVKALADFLCKMGARIDGAGSDTIKITGVAELGGGECAIIPDRIEAGTLMLAAAITCGDVTIRNCPLEYLEALVQKLQVAGAHIDRCHPERSTCPPAVWREGSPLYEPDPSATLQDDMPVAIRIIGPSRIHSADIVTAPHPGFATDLQAQWMAAMTIADGTSVITETIFENRFMHVAELKRMGADITVEGHGAVVKSVPKLSGAPVMATDLRASASLVLAALAAEGTTEIQRVYHIDRGYEHIETKLGSLGARIERVKKT